MACNLAKFVTNAGPYRQPNLNPKQQKALKIYAKAAVLQTLGGTNYLISANTVVDSKTLATDTETATAGMSQEHVVAGLINTWMVKASLDSGTLLLKMKAIATLDKYPAATLDRMELLLECKLLDLLNG